MRSDNTATVAVQARNARCVLAGTPAPAAFSPTVLTTISLAMRALHVLLELPAKIPAVIHDDNCPAFSASSMHSFHPPPKSSKFSKSQTTRIFYIKNYLFASKSSMNSRISFNPRVSSFSINTSLSFIKSSETIKL